VVSWALRGLIRLYKIFLSPLLPPSCRYLPTCSDYAAEAIATHGALGGSWLAAKRLLRCHPWGGSGYDPVPMRRPRGGSGGAPSLSCSTAGRDPSR
jgi:putative membrane protein insertion efficiency factor